MLHFVVSFWEKENVLAEFLMRVSFKGLSKSVGFLKAHKAIECRFIFLRQVEDATV